MSWFFSLFSQGWLGILTGVILATALGFLSWIGWEQWREWRSGFALSKLPPMERLYQQMLKWTAQKGLGKHPAQTPLEYAQVSYQHYSFATAEVIDEICQAYVSWRYGNHAPDLNRLRQRWQQVRNSQ